MSSNVSADSALLVGKVEFAAAASELTRLSGEALEQIRVAVAAAIIDAPHPQRLLTIDQAAVYLGRSPRAVRGLLKARQFPAVRADGRVQVDIRDLDQWIEKNKRDI